MNVRHVEVQPLEAPTVESQALETPHVIQQDMTAGVTRPAAKPRKPAVTPRGKKGK
jgi:hypothetical protein